MILQRSKIGKVHRQTTDRQSALKHNNFLKGSTLIFQLAIVQALEAILKSNRFWLNGTPPKILQMKTNNDNRLESYHKEAGCKGISIETCKS